MAIAAEASNAKSMKSVATVAAEELTDRLRTMLAFVREWHPHGQDESSNRGPHQRQRVGAIE